MPVDKVLASVVARLGGRFMALPLCGPTKSRSSVWAKRSDFFSESGGAGETATASSSHLWVDAVQIVQHRPRSAPPFAAGSDRDLRLSPGSVEGADPVPKPQHGGIPIDVTGGIPAGTGDATRPARLKRSLDALREMIRRVEQNAARCAHLR